MGKKLSPEEKTLRKYRIPYELKEGLLGAAREIVVFTNTSADFEAVLGILCRNLDSGIDDLKRCYNEEFDSLQRSLSER